MSRKANPVNRAAWRKVFERVYASIGDEPVPPQIIALVDALDNPTPGVTSNARH